MSLQLGSLIETFKPNKVGVAAVVLGAGWILLIVLAVWGEGNVSLAAVLLLVLLVAPWLLLLSWLLSVRVSFHEAGISYRSLFGSKEMRWDEVERFYYSAVKESINFVPVGTYYAFKLIDGRGNKISFGNRFEHRKELGNKLLRFTYAPLLQKAVDRLNNGLELDFGAIRLQKQEGLKIKKWFRVKKIPWEQVADYSIDKGTFYVWRVGQKYATGPSLRDVPNAFVLLGLLDSIFQRNEPAD